MSHEPRDIETINFLTRFTKQAFTSAVGVVMSQVTFMQSIEIAHKLLVKHTDTKPKQKKKSYSDWKAYFYLPVLGQIKKAMNTNITFKE